jgi:hypothetical protein
MSIYDSLSIQVNDNSSKEAADSLSIGANDTLSRSLGNTLSGMGHACCLPKANDNLSRPASVPWRFSFRTTPLMPPSAGARAVARWPGQCWCRGQVDAQRVRTQPLQRVCQLQACAFTC